MAKKSGEDYKIAGIKEKVEQEIIVLQAGKIEKDEKLTVEQALIGIEENGIFSEIDLTEETGIVDGYVIKLGYDLWENVIIEGIEKDREVRISAIIEPKGYTNQNVTIEISVKGSNVKVTNIEVPVGMTKKEEGTYEVTKNGTYIVKAILENEQTLEKEIKINTIDKLPPKDFEITAEATTGNGFIIKGQTQDNEETIENVSSGIDRYEYIVIDEEGKEKIYNSNNISGLEKGKYKVYSNCYDNANNLTKSNNIEVEVETWIGIYSEQDLIDITKDLTANYMLMNNIELIKEWKAIGTEDDPNNQFRGILNGNKHKITGLNIKATERISRLIWVYTEGRKSK